MYRVIKRDNSIVDFNLSKIKDAMSLAFQSRQKPCHPDVLDLLALKVTADFSSKVKDELVNVEDIQDSVESVLIKAGITKSRGEGRRLVEQGGVSVDDVKVTDSTMSFAQADFKEKPVVIKKGKKIFHKIEA